jgi:hypothetical protein
MPESTPLFGIVKPTSGAEPADLYGVATRLADSVEDALAGLGQWEEYTPTWTASTSNPTLGNGTLTGRFMRIGNLIHFRISLTFGSTTTVGSGLYAFTLPAEAANFGHVTVGTGTAYDTSANTRAFAMTRTPTATTADLWRASTEASFTHAAPFAWANGDVLTLHGTYEAAA